MKTYGVKTKPDTHPHMLVLTHEDNRVLVPMMKAATLTPDVVKWLDETFEEGAWNWYHGIISFQHKEDAMGFLLQWS